MPAVVDTPLEPARPDALALAAALVTVLAWSSAFVGIRAAGEDLAPGPLSLARLLAGSAVLGLIVFVRRERLPPRADVPRLVLVGLLWFGAYNVLLSAAEQRVDAGTAAMLVNIGPVFIAVLAGLLLGEGFPRTLLLGCAVSFAGVVVIGLATSDGSVEGGWGALLCVAAAAAYACAVIAQKPLLERTSALQITFLACVVGTLACLPFAPGLVRQAGDAQASSLAWALYLGVVPTALGFTTWAYALRRTTAGKMGATTYLVPPVAIVLGWMLLGESPPALALLGGVLCLAGVLVSRRRVSGRRRAPRSRRPRSA
jgi:drug/metabolite transporter (DMT)-like permease